MMHKYRGPPGHELSRVVAVVSLDNVRQLIQIKIQMAIKHKYLISFKTICIMPGLTYLL